MYICNIYSILHMLYMAYLRMLSLFLTMTVIFMHSFPNILTPWRTQCQCACTGAYGCVLMLTTEELARLNHPNRRRENQATGTWRQDGKTTHLYLLVHKELKSPQ